MADAMARPYRRKRGKGDLVDPKDVDVSVTDRTLTISGSRRAAHEGGEGNYLQRELAYGAW